MHAREPDPHNEFFDVVDRHGTPTGEVKRRSAVHQDGDWHRAFHCWVVVNDHAGEPAIVFQRRSLNKDTHPERLDVAVGGHYRAGEGFDEVVREIDEELGISPPREQLVPIGRRWAEGISDRWVDREIQDVYVHCLVDQVSTLRPSFEEITALDVIPAGDIHRLFDGASQRIATMRYSVNPDNTLAASKTAEVDLDDFIPVSDHYWTSGTRAAVSVLSGKQGVTLASGE
jgi:isopentenyldiphosphate isomerase